jgi:hypothetical protein
MTLDRAGAAALILGSIAYIALMAVHPSHVGAPIIGHLSLSALVHGTALATAPVLAFGYVALAVRLGFDRALPVLGLTFALLGIVFGMLAGTMSGLVIPEIMQAAHVSAHPGPMPADPEALRAQLQAAANYTVWCLSWTGRGVAGWVVRGLGVLAGGAILAWQISGTSNLEAGHGALVVTLGQSLWTLMAASLLLAKRENGGAS